MKNQSVYLLWPILDNPRYEGFASRDGFHVRKGSTDLADDFLPGPVTSRNWQAPRLAAIWKPAKVTGRVREFNDYPCVDLLIPAFSPRAVEVLRDLLEPNGELLPLASKLGTYYAYNVTTLADVLDAKRSKLNFSSPGRIFPSTIDRYEFVASKVGRLAIFRIPESLTDAFVTELFAERVRKNALDGFDLVKVWPLPANVDWRKQRRAAGRKRERTELPRGRSLKGNSVVIRLRLSGKGKGTGTERRRVEELMDQIDALLVQPGTRSPQVGSLEGSEFAVAGECRLFLSCPDADALAAKLRPLLRRFTWEPGLVIVRRDAPYTDPDAREQTERVGPGEPKAGSRRVNSTRATKRK